MNQLHFAAAHQHAPAHHCAAAVAATSNYVVVGRIHGDEEDSAFTYQAATSDEAIEQFFEDMWEGKSEMERLDHEMRHGSPCEINDVLISDVPTANA